ncbi:hypothetical protein AVEN_223245-1 [Araneus ventricosus]|uniref:Uncharacterized protein n=1 Tax=Araneus ventricosus TaxID=182803 RepID=A0A4Y2TAR7_ARAVE|nr:hypothetical protein AVEN_223245-1 [Araneus ventricosus]
MIFFTSAPKNVMKMWTPHSGSVANRTDFLTYSKQSAAKKVKVEGGSSPSGRPSQGSMDQPLTFVGSSNTTNFFLSRIEVKSIVIVKNSNSNFDDLTRLTPP